MSKELVIGSNRHETKVAILEDDQLVEVYFQRENEYSLAGSIHKGRVTRVLPGMQSAFVDLGLERDTFLYVSDFFEENEDIDTVAEERPARGERREGRHRAAAAQAAGVPESAVAPEESTRGLEAQPSAAGTENGEPASDRGFRDRRGRRSRRRRHRASGGFPESKYATAGAAAGPAGTSETEQESEPADETGEVIVLPGESLAKYRRTSAASEESLPAEPSASSEPEAGTTEPADPLAAAGEGEDIDRQAAEIALSDLVFAHREESPVQDLEEKVAGVEEASSSERVEQQLDTSEPVGAESASFSAASAAVEPAAPLPDLEIRPNGETAELKPPVITTEPEPSDSGLPSSEPIALDEYEVLTIQEGLTGVDEPVLDELAPEAVETEAETDTPGPESTQEPEEPVQTASVREPGNRAMHRVSRRMRRRRGGHRFSQQSGESGNGAGAAIAPDVRTEMHREGIEDKAVERPERTYPSISDLLKPGQEIIVQIAKEPLGQKGARVTSHIALPGRYVVYMPTVSHLGVSRKIASEEERQRLKRVLQAHRPGTTGGFIVRTAGEGVPEDEIAADMSSLYNLWLDIRAKAERKPAPALLHHDLDIVQRILRDHVTSDFKAIWVDNEQLYEQVVTFMQRFQPALVTRVKMYTRSEPIFDAFNITQELEKALRPKVWLKSGGYIVINQTEALVAIDINTGKYVGKSNRLEDTIVKTNTEAVKEIVRQIRLRDLGGIIVVDFIDMDERKNRQKVMQALEEAMRADKAPYKILQFNDFGLVAITRKRVKQSLERTLCSPCPYCEGAGYVKSVQTVIGEILVEAQKLSRAIEGKNVMLRVHPDVAKVLKASNNRYLEELEEILGRPVLVTGDPALHHQKFDLG